MSYSRQIEKNIFVVSSTERPLTSLLEFGYWNEILKNLRALLGETRFEQFYFQMIFNTMEAVPIPGRPNVFIIADEHQRPTPTLYDGESVVFQSSYSGEIYRGRYDRLFAFPIGYNDQVQLDRPVPFAQRTVNVFFSGNLHRGRRRMFNFYSYLRYLPFALQHRAQARIGSVYDAKYPNSFIRFTNGFMKGLGFEEYAGFIKNSKIVLTPHGSIAEECFRHYEAMKCGCIIISERLPENPFFSNSPIIQIDSWQEGDRIIRELLADEPRMQEVHQASLKWWQDVMSEPAVGRYMKDILLPYLGSGS